ncbi:unnamed protein product [Eruca vesicaria subsp. sativa]|uniref:Uncharacterized protein n=1 Tax=Eruca vesicaria subsp. sativa TaxID=29727 RepID=A0ABC8JCY0_ERUVS|nr:unnamed protein product [Eruca vesicaria subsp. sativa]
MTSSSPKPNLCEKCQGEITYTGPPQRKRKIEYTAAAPEPDKDRLARRADDGSSDYEIPEFDVPIKPWNLYKFDENETGYFRDMANIYARFGLHTYNARKGTNFQLSRVDKYISHGVFTFSLTFEATDPADGSCFTFQARVFRDSPVIGAYYRLLTEGCRIKPGIIPGTRETIHRWDWDAKVYEDILPEWYSDDALNLPSNDQFYQVQDSDIRENDWLKLYADLAMYALKEKDMSGFESWLPLEINKVVVQTFEDVKSKEKLKAGNAIFYYSFKNMNAPPHALCEDHRVIIRRTTTGLPGHACLDFKSCPGRNSFKGKVPYETYMSASS